MQLSFRKTALLQALVLGMVIMLSARQMFRLPDRLTLGRHYSAVGLQPVRFDANGFAPVRLAGAWRLTSADSRFGGVSALAVDRGGLIALSDAGVLIRFPRPVGNRIVAELAELPDGPCDARFKYCRDSEALVRDPAGRGWWVTFENHHGLWLYDEHFGRALQRIPLTGRGWRRNRGVEAMAAAGQDLLLFPENGQSVLRLTRRHGRTVTLGNGARLSDAVRLPDGRLLVMERGPTLLGFVNRLAWVDEVGGGFRLRRWLKLPLGPLDNVEAMAAEQLPGGATRLWLMTDDNFQRPLRTLLIALDLPATKPPAG